ncbi:MAG: hypothetical protein ACWGSD_12510 [Thermodesulfobacteriota bacterium]
MREKGSETLEKIKTWLIILLMVFGIVTYGIVVYVTIGDKGPSAWNFGAISDAPGESPFSTEPLK